MLAPPLPSLLSRFPFVSNPFSAAMRQMWLSGGMLRVRCSILPGSMDRNIAALVLRG
jgi:hypothetical protein